MDENKPAPIKKNIIVFISTIILLLVILVIVLFIINNNKEETIINNNTTGINTPTNININNNLNINDNPSPIELKTEDDVREYMADKILSGGFWDCEKVNSVKLNGEEWTVSCSSKNFVTGEYKFDIYGQSTAMPSYIDTM